MALRRLTDHAGYLEIDHRDSPGLRAEDVAHVPGALAVAGGTRLEADTKQCRHCERTVLLRPDRLQVRERGYCRYCHAYLCDACHLAFKATGVCRPFAQVMDQAHNIAAKYLGREDDPAANPDIVLTDAWREAAPITMGLAL